MSKMDTSLLKNIIQQYETEALGVLNGNLAADRAASLRAYLSQPYGNEVEGRSQVVTSDVADAIEGILPGLVRVFTSGDDIATFEPTGPEDEASAEQETDYINHVLTQQNRFLPFLQTWLRDGLITKVGYAKAIWEDSESTESETYRGLNEDELTFLLQDPEIEITGQAVDDNGITIKVKTKRNTGQIKLYNCPPEEVLVNKDHQEVSLRTARFVQHRPRMTIADIRAMGYDIPDDIADYDADPYGDEWQARNRYEDEWNSGEPADPASRIVTFKESYIRADFDGKGMLTLHRVCMVGDEVLADDEWDTIPICAWTPLIMPHRHVGRSLAEQVEDIQKIKTGVLRAGMDSLYLALNGRYAISDQVNLDDMLVSRPGGIVRLLDGAKPSDGHIMPMVPPDVSGSAFPMLEYWDGVRETRTGVTRYNQGLDANSLNKTATGMQAIMSAAQQRIELVARTFAETGLRDLMLLCHELTRKHNVKPQVIRMRGEWLPVDPRSWKTRYDMTISVGLGTGNREQQMANLTQIMLIQREALQIGVCGPEQIYNSASRMAEAAGFKNPDAFFLNPANQPPKQPQPDPKVLESQAKIQMEQAKLQVEQAKLQADMQVAQAKLAIEQAKNEAEIVGKREELDAQREAEVIKAQTEVQIAQIQAAAQAEVARIEAAMQALQARLDAMSQAIATQASREPIVIGGGRKIVRMQSPNGGEYVGEIEEVSDERPSAQA